MKRKVVILLALLLPVQVIAVRITAHYPQWIEKTYSSNLYPYLARAMRTLFGWIPFSVGDILYTVLVLALLRWIYRRFKTKFKNPEKWLLRAMATFSVFYFCFHFLWGMNYYRQPLHQTLGIADHYTEENLIALTQKLIVKTNEYQEKLAPHKDSAVSYPMSAKKMRKLSVLGYRLIAEEFPELDYRSPSIKSSLYSLPLTYMGFSGYLNPLTHEAQVNHLVPDFRMPQITTHEMGHQLGFAKENEANFMACLATMQHSNPYFKYSGYSFAMQACYNEVRRRNPELAADLIKDLHPGVLKNIAEVRQFWEAYQNPAEPVFKLFYGNYLKVNNQPQGMQSYNYVVALLVNYYGAPGKL